MYFRCCGCHYYEGNFNYFEQVAAGPQTGRSSPQNRLKKADSGWPLTHRTAAVYHRTSGRWRPPIAPKPYIFPKRSKSATQIPRILNLQRINCCTFTRLRPNSIVNANLKAVCFMHAFYPTACVSTHAVVLCGMNGRQMPLSPAPTSNSVPLGLIRRGYVSHRYIGPSVTP